MWQCRGRWRHEQHIGARGGTKHAPDALCPQGWLVVGQPLTAQKGAVGRAQVQKVDGTAAMVKHHSVSPRGRRVLEHDVHLRAAAGDESRLQPQGHDLDKVATAVHREARRAGLPRQHAPRRRVEPVSSGRGRLGSWLWWRCSRRRCCCWRWRRCWMVATSAAEHLRWVPAPVFEHLVQTVRRARPPAAAATRHGHANRLLGDASLRVAGRVCRARPV